MILNQANAGDRTVTFRKLVETAERVTWTCWTLLPALILLLEGTMYGKRQWTKGAITNKIKYVMKVKTSPA